MTLLPSPATNQAFCNVSALEGGTLDAPDDIFIADGVPGVRHIVPALGFLIQHSQRPEKIVFDLGIHPDITAYPPATQEMIAKVFKVQDTPRIVESLAKGSLKPDDIDYVCLSHVHFDHVGNPREFKKSTFLVGDGCLPLFEDAYPKNPTSHLSSDLLPQDRTRYLNVAEWGPIGPFPKALDFYEDGSLYIVDSPGHIEGHINILARTSYDGAWIYLAGDSAHHWRILTGESQIKTGMPYGPHFCMHSNKQTAEEHIAHIRELREVPRLKVILAHDGPWYDANKGGKAFWPGKIPPNAV